MRKLTIAAALVAIAATPVAANEAVNKRQLKEAENLLAQAEQKAAVQADNQACHDVWKVNSLNHHVK